MGPEQQKVSNDLFANFDNYKSILYNGVSHGFLVRGDLSNPEQKEAMETGFKNSVDFILYDSFLSSFFFHFSITDLVNLPPTPVQTSELFLVA